LDQLSLQTRAARVLAKYASGRETSVLAVLPMPNEATCDTDYVDEPSAHFELLGSLWPEDAGRRADAIVRRIDTAQHEAEIMPSLRLAANASAIDDAHLARVGESLARLFARARDDDAGFTATELGVANQTQFVLQRLDRQPALRDRLHQAYLDYVQAHLQEKRCLTSLKGNHWLLEQRFVAELPDEKITSPETSPTPVNDDSALNYDAVEVIRTAGASIRELLLENPDEDKSDLSLDNAGNTFLDQIDTGPVAEAATQDTTGRTQRAQWVETLRYLEYAPPGAARDRGFAMLFRLLAARHYQQDHDTWFGDLIHMANQSTQWPDRAQRLTQMADAQEPVLKVYAMLMQRGQFP
jgi:hypothetical protein